MISSVTCDLTETRERENRVLTHIGRMAVTAAGIDEMAAILLARVMTTGNYTDILRVLGDENFGTRMRLLKKALPDTWPDKRRLFNAMQKFEDERNSLAHSQLATLFAVDINGESVQTRLSNSKGVVRAITLAVEEEFGNWQLDGQVIYVTLLYLARASTLDIGSTNLRDIALEMVGTEQKENLDAVDRVFPVVPQDAKKKQAR